MFLPVFTPFFIKSLHIFVIISCFQMHFLSQHIFIFLSLSQSVCSSSHFLCYAFFQLMHNILHEFALHETIYSRGSQQDLLRENSPDRNTLGRKQRFVFSLCTHRTHTQKWLHMHDKGSNSMNLILMIYIFWDPHVSHE